MWTHLALIAVLASDLLAYVWMRSRLATAEQRIDELETLVGELEKDMDDVLMETTWPRPQTTCTRAPAGWRCTRGAGHDGPCAALPVDDEMPRHSE